MIMLTTLVDSFCAFMSYGTF